MFWLFTLAVTTRKNMNSNSILVTITCAFALSEFIYLIYRRFKSACDPKSLTYSLKQLYDPKDKTAQFNKVIFFPDPGIACRRTLAGRICHDEQCRDVHDKTSLSVLLNVINLSKQTLDVCIFLISSGILGDALVECQRRGVILRIITEERNSGEEGEMMGSQIGKLRAAAIQVRCKASSGLMHHKFLIADNEILVNGSFNWTTQAVMGNSENLIITSEKSLVTPFILEFKKLWDDLNFQGILDDDINNANIMI